jgi:hypothetical protein
VCEVCDGALFDWRVADLEIGGAPVGRLLHMPIGDLKELFWASDRLSYLFCRFPAQYASGLRLNTPIREIAPEVRRFLRIWGALVGLAASQRVAKKGALAEDLVLIDGPGPLVAAHLQELAGLLGELSAAGATVIYGGIPESLESQCSCVLRLAFSAGADKRRDAEEFLDARYARISGVSGC